MSKPKIVRVKFSGGFHNQDRKITLHIPENLIIKRLNNLTYRPSEQIYSYYVNPYTLTTLQRKRLHSHICGITMCICHRDINVEI